MTDPDPMTAQVAELLERCGLSPAEARAAAVGTVGRLHAASPGTIHGRLWPAQIGSVWEAAARAGRRRLVLEITAEAQDLDDDTGRVNVRVVGAEDWPEWTPEHTRQRAATDALLRHTPAPALGLSGTDHMARGEDCPDVWTPDDQGADAPARARAEELN